MLSLLLRLLLLTWLLLSAVEVVGMGDGSGSSGDDLGPVWCGPKSRAL